MVQIFLESQLIKNQESQQIPVTIYILLAHYKVCHEFVNLTHHTLYNELFIKLQGTLNSSKSHL